MVDSTERPDPPVRVAIIGGGIAGLTAAWHIARQPGYTVDVYERSWRLGGKAASVRDAARPHPGARAARLAGVLRERVPHDARVLCRGRRAELGTPGGKGSGPNSLAHGSIDDAFFPEPNIGVAGRDASKDWIVWSGNLPPAKGLPGEALDLESNPFTINSYLLRCFDLLKTLMLSVIGPARRGCGRAVDDRTSAPRPTRPSSSISRSTRAVHRGSRRADGAA